MYTYKSARRELYWKKNNNYNERIAFNLFALLYYIYFSHHFSSSLTPIRREIIYWFFRFTYTCGKRVCMWPLIENQFDRIHMIHTYYMSMQHAFIILYYIDTTMYSVIIWYLKICRYYEIMLNEQLIGTAYRSWIWKNDNNVIMLRWEHSHAQVSKEPKKMCTLPNLNMNCVCISVHCYYTRQ